MASEGARQLRSASSARPQRAVAASTAGGQRPEHIEERKDLQQRPHKQYKQEDRRSLKKRKDRGSSRFRGVTWNKAEKKWKAQLQQEGKKIMLYSGDDEEAAARAWDVAAAEAGRTNLNFSTADMVEQKPKARMKADAQEAREVVTVTAGREKRKRKSTTLNVDGHRRLPAAAASFS